MTGARIVSGASVFLVADVEKAAAHYRDALGFSFDRFWGDPPDFCMVWRGQFCVMLCRAPDRADIRPISTVATSVWDAYFWVHGVDALHAELVERGARVLYKPFDKPYGVREFAVKDLDGYQVAFGEELSA